MVKESEWEPKSKCISYTFDVLVRISESCVVFIMVHMDITKEGNAICYYGVTQAENIWLSDLIKFVKVIKTL